MLFGLNPFAFITMLKPGSDGPHVGDISTLGSANAVKRDIPANPEIPKAIKPNTNSNLDTMYISRL